MTERLTPSQILAKQREQHADRMARYRANVKAGATPFERWTESVDSIMRARGMSELTLKEARAGYERFRRSAGEKAKAKS